MSHARIYLLIAIGALCVAGGIAVGAMLLHEAAHPLATRDPWMVWLVYDLPYLLLMGAGALSFSRTWLLVLIFIITGLSVLIITAACYQEMEISLFILNARAAGQRGMSCGPPMSVFVLPVAYLMSFIAVAVSLGLLPFQASRPRRYN